MDRRWLPLKKQRKPNDLVYLDRLKEGIKFGGS